MDIKELLNKPKKEAPPANRADRRRYYKNHHKKNKLGSWNDFNSVEAKQEPYVK